MSSKEILNFDDDWEWKPTNIWEKIQKKYWETVPYSYRPKNLWYSFSCWAWKRYTTVKPRYLSHEWHDKDTILANCCFEILCRFIEDECTPEIVDWYSEECPKKIVISGEEKHVRDVMQELYDWWINYYNNEAIKEGGRLQAEWWKLSKKRKRQQPMDNEERLAWNKLKDFEDSLQQQLKQKLHLIIELKDYLWT